MALRWNWDEKCGEATFVDTFREEDGPKTYTVNLYVGNAYLIFLNEWEEDGHNMYSLSTFWADKEHMKNCLGLNKKGGYTENIHNKPYSKLTKIRLNKSKCRYTKDIVTALVQAFDNIEIEIFSEEENNDTENA